MAQINIPLDYEYNDVKHLLRDIIVSQDIAKLLHLGAEYKLDAMNDDGGLLSLALSISDSKIKNLFVIYLVKVHGWRPTLNQFIDTLRKIDKEPEAYTVFQSYLGSTSEDTELMIHVFLTVFLHREYKRRYAGDIVQYRSFMQMSKMSELLEALPPFPKQKEAITFAKKQEKFEVSFYLPEFSELYGGVIQAFAPTRAQFERIDPSI